MCFESISTVSIYGCSGYIWCMSYSGKRKHVVFLSLKTGLACTPSLYVEMSPQWEVGGWRKHLKDKVGKMRTEDKYRFYIKAAMDIILLESVLARLPQQSSTDGSLHQTFRMPEIRLWAGQFLLRPLAALHTPGVPCPHVLSYCGSVRLRLPSRPL